MGALTEAEIFGCLSENLRLAAQDADTLATSPRKGQTYDAFRKRLKLIEGACRQAAAWRQDCRWYPVGMQMAKVHATAGAWLRGAKHEGRRIALTPAEQKERFTKLAAVLRSFHTVAEDLRTKATGRVGMILPRELPGPHRDTRPVHISRTPGGIIIPAGVAA